MSADSPSPAPAAVKLQARLAECFERGTHLMDVEKNHDYAHAMFAECVIHEPANLAYAEALLKNLRTKSPGHQRKTSLFSSGGRRELKKAFQQKQWKSVFRLGIEILKTNPWDITTLRSIAQACAQLHYNEVELVYLKQALEANPKDIATNKHCAQSLARMGQFDQAIACWHRIETIHPGDKEAARMIGELSERKLKYPAGRSPPTAPLSAEATAPTTAEETSPAVTEEVLLTPRQQLERAVADDPYDVSNYLGLADLLSASERFDEAEAALNRGIATVGEHSALVDHLERIRAQRAEWNTAAAAERRQTEQRLKRKPIRIPWLELALGIAGVALLFQFFPAFGPAVGRLFDIRNWSRLTWFTANVLGLLVLCAIRFGPQLFRQKAKQYSKRKLKRALNQN